MKPDHARILVSLRVRKEILNWFKENFPSGYQTAMHDVLSRHVERQTEQSIRAAGRAQEIFRNYHASCFWHYDKNLEISPKNIQLVIDGLRKYGGREGFILAETLCR